MDKLDIINHVEDLDANQLAQYIMSGVVTLDELKQTGCLDHTKRIAIQQLLQEHEQRIKQEHDIKKRQDQELWNQIQSSTDVDTLEYWILSHPNNLFLEDAKNRLFAIKKDREKIYQEKEEILTNIRRDINKYGVDEVKSYLDKGLISIHELRDCEIPDKVIDNLREFRKLNLEMGNIQEDLPEGPTEVYFWGYTGSGKTCALGAILQVAAHKGFLNMLPSKGLDYGTQLHNIFSDDGVANDYLPAPTPFDKTQYIAATLAYPKEKSQRHVSMIELSGEIFKSFYDMMSHGTFSDGQYEKTFTTVQRYLNSKNKKIHFFFIDYSKNNIMDNQRAGVRHSDYLQAAANYFDKSEIFKNHTDAIYVVLTKSDLMVDEDGNRVPEKLWVQYAKKHLEGSNYTAFISTLKRMCSKYGINGGKLTIEPFSLGEVYFKDICNFDGKTAGKILDILMKRISKDDKFSWKKIFNK